MTNAEKFLKDGVDVEELASEINELMLFCQNYVQPFRACLVDFFKKEVKPILSEDEKVILQGLKAMGIEKISRDKENDICFYYSSANRYGELGEKFAKINHLFQFIKPRRKI